MIFHIFQVHFFDRTNLKLIVKQKKALGGSGGMLPQKIFENLHTVMTILVLFE